MQVVLVIPLVAAAVSLHDNLSLTFEGSLVRVMDTVL